MVSELTEMINFLGIPVDDCDFDSNNDKKAFQIQQTHLRVRAEL